jgi:LmbE family N-acetylglucosaminyl deacetylase
VQTVTCRTAPPTTAPIRLVPRPLAQPQADADTADALHYTPPRLSIRRTRLLRPLIPSLITALLAGYATCSLAAHAAVPNPTTGAPPKLTAPTTFPPLTSTTSLLVVSPHPDDEALCCAGVMQRVLQAGGRVSIVWLTSGDGSELDLLVIEKSLFLRPSKLRDLAVRRMQESRDAAAILGIPADHLFFLGYPDRGIFPIITDNYITPYRSKFTASTAVPYAAAVSPGHAYTGLNLEHDFESVLDRVHPTLILAPSPRDSHPDHRATGLVAIRAMARRNELSRMRYWIVHGGEFWPIPRGYEPDSELNPPPLGHGLSQTPFKLEPDEEHRKFLAISAYRTQMEVMSSFLLSFVRTNELYSTNPMPSN